MSAFKYSIQIMGSKITLSLANDEASMEEHFKSQLVNEGRSSNALTFVNLYIRFSPLMGSVALITNGVHEC